jgi:hypothetical protein
VPLQTEENRWHASGNLREWHKRRPSVGINAFRPSHLKASGIAGMYAMDTFSSFFLDRDHRLLRLDEYYIQTLILHQNLAPK